MTDPLQDLYEALARGQQHIQKDLRERATLAPLLDELIRAAKQVCDLDLREFRPRVERLSRAVNAYGAAHLRTDLQPPIPDPNEGYDHRKLSWSHTTHTCGHCGRTDVGTMAGGYGQARHPETRESVDLCHPSVPGRPDCYRLVTIYHHNMPCTLRQCLPDPA